MNLNHQGGKKKHMKQIKTYITYILASILLHTLLYSGVPTGMNYQGRYRENQIFITGRRAFQFRITNNDGTVVYWKSPIVNLQVEKGLFNYVLHCSTVDWAGVSPFLEVRVGPEGTTNENALTVLLPREQIMSSAYAFYASSATYAAKAGSGGDSVDVSGSGTTNKIAKFTGSKTIGNSRIEDANIGVIITTNVYIRTTVGSDRIIFGATNGDMFTYGGIYPGADTGGFNYSCRIDYSPTNFYIGISTHLYVKGNVGIGTTSPIKKLHIVDTNGGIFFDASDSTFNRFKSTAVDPTIGKDLLISAQNPGNTPDLYIKSNGNVGIGTTAPQSKLDVNGNIQISNATIPMGLMTEVGGTTPILNFSVNFREPNKNNTYRGAAFRIDTRDTYPLFQWLTRSAGSTTENVRMVLTEDGNVGIGTTIPSEKLDVEGNLDMSNYQIKNSSGISFPNSLGPNQAYTVNGAWLAFGHPGVSEDFIGYRNNTFYFMDSPGGGDTADPRVVIGGYVGIGTTNPSYPLHMGSGAYCSTAGVWTNASDIAYKKNITDLRYGLSEVLKLQPREFDMKQDNSHQIGFIAQEIEKVIPEVVSGQEGQKGISYGNLAAVLVKAIQEQQQQIQQQQQEIQKLKLEIEEIRNKIEEIKNKI
jgi:hypothetical protein